jgi:hypothetical protein
MARSLTLLLVVVCLAGCGSARSTIQLQSAAARQQVLAPKWVETIARITDENTIDIFMLDQPLETALDYPNDPHPRPVGAEPQLDVPAALQICHIHVFLTPKAGRTPIQASACTATVRHLILAGGQAGEYGGAGFMTPNLGGDERFVRGSIVDGRARLIRSTAGFVDQLHDAEVNGSVAAAHEPAKARAIERALERWRYRYFGDSARGGP